MAVLGVGQFLMSEVPLYCGSVPPLTADFGVSLFTIGRIPEAQSLFRELGRDHVGTGCEPFCFSLPRQSPALGCQKSIRPAKQQFLKVKPVSCDAPIASYTLQQSGVVAEPVQTGRECKTQYLKKAFCGPSRYRSTSLTRNCPPPLRPP